MDRYTFRIRSVSIQIITSRVAVLFALLTLLLSPTLASASYLPGQTLNPSCFPLDAGCVVVAPGTSSTTNTASTFVATSTTATSTFAGSVQIAGTASSTNLFSTIANITTALINSLTVATANITTLVASTLSAQSASIGSLNLGTALGIASGGTGITTAPTPGQILVGNSSGGYTLTSTSSLGISGGSVSTSASSTLLSDNNTWSGTQTLASLNAQTVSLGSLSVNGNSLFNGSLTVTGVSTSSFYGPLDFTNVSGLSLRDMSGTSQYIGANWPAQRWELAQGSSYSPVLTAGPTVKISRTEGVASSTCGNNNTDNECNATLAVYSHSDAVAASSSQQTEAILAAAQGEPIGTDVVGLTAWGRLVGVGTGIGTGAYIEGRRDTATGRALGAEVRVSNYTATPGTYNPAAFSGTDGLWITAYSSHANTPVGAGIQFGALNATQFLTGIGFTTGSIASSSIRDDSSSQTSIAINGTHQYALTAGPTAGSVGIGVAAPVYQLQVATSSGSIAEFDGLGSNSASINLNPASAGHQASVYLLSAGAPIYQIGKQTDNSFFIYDATNSRSFFTYARTNGSLTLNQLGGNVGIGTGTSTPPLYLLDVAGTGHFVSLVDAANFVATSSSATSLFNGNLTVNGTTTLASATSSTFAITSIPNALLSTNANGSIIATTSIGANVLANTIIPIANGGTNQTSQSTNGINYFDGTHITSSSNLTWSGGSLGVVGSGSGSALAVSGTVSNASGVSLTPIVQSSATGQQQIINAQASIQPTGATLGSIFGMLFLPALSNSATQVTNENGIYSRLDEAASFTGSVTNAIAFHAATSKPLGNPYGSYYGFVADGTQNGDGTTTGTITNAGIQINSSTASSSAGGTINNYAGIFTLPSGSPNGGSTNNYGLTISGNGGTSAYGGTATNYSLYNSSLANSYFAGNVGIGTTTPGSLLSIGNTNGINFSMATSTFSSTGGINLTSGCFAVNGVCIGGSTAAASSTLLADNNTFSGADMFSNGLNVGSASFGYKQGSSIILYASTTNNSLAVGASAAAAWMTASSTPWYDVAIGQGALATTPTNGGAQYNTAVGYQALSLNITGASNTASGQGALLSNITGSSNTANGVSTLRSNTIGSFNAASGQSALYSNTTGNNNAAMGLSALYYNQSATSSVAVGANAGHGTGLYYNQGGTAVGYNSGYNFATSSNYNTLLGYQSGFDITTGANNIAIGNWTTTGTTITTGSGNILMGNNISLLPSGQAGSNQLNIGNLIFATGLGSGSTLSSGYVGIGTTSPYSKLEVWGPDTASTTAFSVVNNASTTVFASYDNGNATYSGSLFQSSDQRLKTNISSLDASSSLSLVDSLRPVSYTRIDQPDQGTTLGFIAQEVQKLFPNLVTTTAATALTPGGTLTLNYTGLIAPLVAAVQALQSEIASIQNTVAGLAQSITTGTVNTSQLCVTDSGGKTCLTRAQVDSLLAAVSQSAATSAQTSTTTPPVISISGANPAIIQVGASYSDLGATITGPTGDTNLDIKTFFNGVLMSPLSVDTSQAATDTISYVVTDQNGLTSTSTRTVIVQAPNTQSAPASPTPATSTPAVTVQSPQTQTASSTDQTAAASSTDATTTGQQK